MIRSAAGKVMWVGRATVFLVGLAVILALVFGVASTAFGHAGYAGLFHLGHNNAASTPSTLTKSGAGPALSLRVGSGAPLAVNSSAQVANLNADKLDGKTSAAFLPSEIYTQTVTKTIPPNTTSEEKISCGSGDLAISGGFSLVDRNTHVSAFTRDSSLEHVWVVTVETGSTAGDLYSVHAVCADLPPLR